LRVFLEAIRLRNCLIVYFGVLVGATVTLAKLPLDLDVHLAAAAAFLITGGGNAINDYFDIDIDRINKPERPLPSNRMSKSDVLMLSLTMFFVGLWISKYVNTYCAFIAVVNAAALILYAKFSKNILIVSNFVISYLVASVFIFGAFSAFDGPIWKAPFIGILAVLAACAFFMTFSREIVKDIEDIEGDKKSNARTLPIVVGMKKSRYVAILFAAVAILLSFLPVVLPLGEFNTGIYKKLIIPADSVFIAALTLSPKKSQRVMVLSMVFALVAFFLGNLA